MSEVEVVWQDPPPKRWPRNTTKWDKRLAPVMEKPNCWALIRTFDSLARASNAAGSLRRGTLAKPPGRWEFIARTNPDERGELYARYLGPGGE